MATRSLKVKSQTSQAEDAAFVKDIRRLESEKAELLEEISRLEGRLLAVEEEHTQARQERDQV